MANRIKIKRSAVQNKVPLTTDLELGELALNTYDGRLYTKKDNGVASIVQIGAGVSVPVSDTAPSSPSGGDLWFDSVGGRCYIYYVDANSSQWVDISPASATIEVSTLIDAATSNTIYVGKAPLGSSESASVWSITRSLYNSAGVRTSLGVATNVNWTGRATHTYT